MTLTTSASQHSHAPSKQPVGRCLITILCLPTSQGNHLAITTVSVPYRNQPEGYSGLHLNHSDASQLFVLQKQVKKHNKKKKTARNKTVPKRLASWQSSLMCVWYPAGSETPWKKDDFFSLAVIPSRRTVKTCGNYRKCFIRYIYYKCQTAWNWSLDTNPGQNQNPSHLSRKWDVRKICFLGYGLEMDS